VGVGKRATQAEQGLDRWTGMGSMAVAGDLSSACKQGTPLEDIMASLPPCLPASLPPFLPSSLSPYFLPVRPPSLPLSRSISLPPSLPHPTGVLF